MKHCFSFLVIIHLSFPVLCQMAAPSTIPSKPPIDSAAIANWADLLWSEPSISPNGKYFMYPIENLPAGSKTLVIQSTENGWKKEFIGADKGFFSGDGKKAVFKTNDSLYILSLGKDQVLCIGNVTSYKNPKEGAGQWLAYVTKTNELTLQNLLTDKKQQYQNVWDYQFDNSGRALLMKEKIKADSATSESVEWVTLSTSKQYTVWQTSNDREYSASRFSFDEQGMQLVFTVENKSKVQSLIAIWYYREGMAKAIEKVTNETPGIDSGMIVSNKAPTFSKKGKYIFFKIQAKPEPPLKPDPNAVQVDVWSYKDSLTQNIQADNLKNSDDGLKFGLKKELTAVVSIEGTKAICLQKPGGVTEIYTALSGDFVIVSRTNFTGDKVWLKDSINYYLVALKAGTQKLFNSGKCNDFLFSPDEKYLVYYDHERNNLFSYNVQAGEIKNISSLIPESLRKEADKGSKYLPGFVGIAGWLGSEAIMIYDNYDIWKVDPSGKNAPVNLTNGYGKSHHIKFRLALETNIGESKEYLSEDPLFISALNTENKNNGFFRIYPTRHQNPEPLVFSPHLFCVGEQSNVGLTTMAPVKADKADVWIIKRQTASEAPSFFLTKNFKDFTQLTNLQPQKTYNWFTTELITWKQFDGENCQGLLYKPENFNPNKKYPVIVNYYEKRSDQLHQFLQPAFINANLNIPWFVSRGYLVFVPDIHYTVGKAGECIVNAVVSGTKNLFRFSFVDSTRIGIQGHSFGGYETNYLVTHTGIFAAATEGAGSANLISHYGTLIPDGVHTSLISKLEGDKQYYLQTTYWDNLNAYIANSPIFNADKVSTPLLMMHNKKDALVPWSQAVEFFIALRRLNKKVWMLQYDKGGHGVRGKDKIDYTIRMTQFFDHYLKGAPAPRWMVKGIPANLKGIDPGYELSNLNEEP